MASRALKIRIVVSRAVNETSRSHCCDEWKVRSLLRPACFPVYASTDLFGVSTSAVAVATLGRSGWLILSPQGLSPCKKRQASLGALTAQRSAASRANRTLRIRILVARGLAAATFCWAASSLVLRIARLPSFVRVRTTPLRRLASRGVSLDRSRHHSATPAYESRDPLLHR